MTRQLYAKENHKSKTKLETVYSTQSKHIVQFT